MKVLGDYYVQGGSLDVHDKWFLDVNGCLKFFRGAFRRFSAWSFSMLLALGFLLVVSPDYGHYICSYVDGAESLD